MATLEKAPFVSVVISTRDRPILFQVALRSVLDQTLMDKEVVVVIDGSNDENLALYRELKEQYTDVVFHELEHRPNGHGQSYSMNSGAHRASGKFLCFLDDDDQWTDNNYLERLFVSVNSCNESVDVHYSNQKALFADGTVQLQSVWLQDLIPKLDLNSTQYGESFRVDVKFLLSSEGFAHLNCTAVRRDFFFAIGGMDESIRYENDRDVYIRCVDAARVMLFSPHFMSLHNVPDRNKKSNMSTINTEIDKKMYQLRVFDKGISLSNNARVAHFCCKAKSYELKHAARILAKNGAYRSAAYYAKESLLIGFNMRWLAYTFWLMFQALVRPSSSSSKGGA